MFLSVERGTVDSYTGRSGVKQDFPGKWRQGVCVVNIYQFLFSALRTLGDASVSIPNGETETQRRLLLAITLVLDSETPPWPSGRCWLTGGRHWCGVMGDFRFPVVSGSSEN